MSTYSKMSGLALGLLLLSGLEAQAYPTRSLGAILGESSKPGLMQEGEPELAPMPFVMFCMTYPAECAAGSSEETVVLTDEKITELQAVNRSVNAAIRSQADRTLRRLWTLGASVGDCNAYAVEKRHRLIAAGWPTNAVLLTAVKTSWGEGHLVVTVRTDRGELILDNLTGRVLPWQKVNYSWKMRQSSADPMKWVSLKTDDTWAVSSNERSISYDVETVEKTKFNRRDGKSWAPPKGMTVSSYDIGM